MDLQKIITTGHQGASSEEEMALLWLENEFRQSIGTGKVHEIVCEVHKGGSLLDLVKSAIAKEQAQDWLDILESGVPANNATAGERKCLQ